MKQESQAERSSEASRARIRRLENVRIWFLLAAALLLIVGYAVNRWAVLASSAIPLLVVLLITYRIKRLEEGSKDE